MRRLSIAVTVLALCACSGGTTPPKNLQPPQACPQSIPVPPTMVSPTNGATGVADGNFTLVVSYQYGATLTLSAAGGQQVVTQGPSPVTGGVGYPVPALQAHTLYNVSGLYSTGPGCPTYSALIGTFTTI